MTIHPSQEKPITAESLGIRKVQSSSEYLFRVSDKENDPKHVWKTVSLPAVTIHNGAA